MGSVVGIGTARQLTDEDGDLITSSNRLPVETEQDDAFSTWKNYPDFAVETGTAQALNHANHCNESITDAKEIIIQTDDANTGYIMVGYTAGTTLVGSVGSRAGIKLNGGKKQRGWADGKLFRSNNTGKL